MPGIYLHIPFCKQACTYCNFHFSTSVRLKDDLLSALIAEAHLQSEWFGGAEVTSLYLGGGTPSLLSADELKRLFEVIFTLHTVSANAEITLEANPDDLSPSYLRALASTPVNRLSIGIQSFSDAELHYMNRAHTAREAHVCIDHALEAGFANLTVDLIYGSPVSTAADWERSVRTVAEAGIQHVSAYALTVEPRTALAHAIKNGLSKAVDEDEAAARMEQLMELMEQYGYEQYEISNFAKPGRRAVHNSSYWAGEPYLGIGPSAHSYDGYAHRQWNVANNPAYIRSIQEGLIPCEKEVLSTSDRYNEYVMTSLRTSEGCAATRIAAFGADYVREFESGASGWIGRGLAEWHEGRLRLTRAGRLLADRIAADLFVAKEDAFRN